MVMKDISRFAHRTKQRYAAVRLQQARPLLESDFNEQSRFVENEQRSTLQHLVGPRATLDRGFVLGQPFAFDDAPSPRRIYTQQTPELRNNATLANETWHPNDGEAVDIKPLTIRAGELLLGGQLLVLEQAEHIAFQRDYLQLRADDLPDTTVPSRTLYALHCWEQAVTSREDEEVREPMLGGEATSIRIRRMRRVEAFPGVPENVQSCQDFADHLDSLYNYARLNPDTSELESAGRLSIRLTDTLVRGRCAPEGAENLTLRIMLTAARRFVWSTDKPQIFRVAVRGLDETTADARITIQMLDAPQSVEELPLLNRVVELLPFGAILGSGSLSDRERHPHSKKVAAEIGAFTRVTRSYDASERDFEVDRSAVQMGEEPFGAVAARYVYRWDPAHPEAADLRPPEDPNDDVRYFYMRLWHEARTTTEIEIDATNPVALPLLGVIATFAPGRRGDFWYVSLRWDGAGIQPANLLTEPGGVPPHGPKRYVTPIALVTDRVVVEGTTSRVRTDIVDCMPRLERATGDSCVTFTVGDGTISFGDFRSIQAALDALPSSGGRIKVLPGHYADELHIVRRRNIVLEGCGESSVLETRLRSPSHGLVDVISSQNVSITGFRLNAVEQFALRIRDSMEIKAGDLHVLSGIHGEGELFAPGAWGTSVPLIDCLRSAVVEFSGISMVSAQRPALRCLSSELVQIDDLHVTGLLGEKTQKNQTQVGFGATQPMVTISGSSLVKVRKSELEAFGQVALSVRGRSQDVELNQLSIRADEHVLTQVTVTGDTETVKFFPVADMRSCVDVESGDRVTIERSQFLMAGNAVSDHAAVVLKGSDLAVRRCRIDANSPYFAWGGLQVRGGSERVELRYNRIRGGVGHGITLGSVYWYPVSSPSPSPSPGVSAEHSPARYQSRGRRREGAGQAQTRLRKILSGTTSTKSMTVDLDLGTGFSDEGGVDYLPTPEGTIFDLVITDNRIEAMQTSGISVLTVMGLRRHGGDLVEIERARIENNTIEGNVLLPGSKLPTVISEELPFPAALAGTGLRIPVLPIGGIILSSASAIEIRNNIIRKNGASEESTPITGIFVLTGDTISITNNRVTGNGHIPGGTTTLRPGVRAGIAVMLAGTGSISDLDVFSPVLEGRVLLDAEGSSLRILGNNVVQPSGRALHVVATGPVTIQGNFFSTQSAQGSNYPEDLFAIGDVIYLQNLGMPWEAFDVDSLLLDRPRDQRSPDWPTAHNFTDEELKFLSPEMELDSPYRGTEQFFSEYTTPPWLASYLRNSSLTAPRFFVGEGGRTSFSDNQIVFEWKNPLARTSTQVAPLSYVPVAILGLDHVAVTGNQFGMRIGDRRSDHSDELGSWAKPITSESEPVLSQVMVMGGTVDVSRNRIAAPPEDASASLITFAETLSIVSLNQTTRAIYTTTFVESWSTSDALGPPPAASLSREMGNQVIYEEPAGPYATMKEILAICSRKLLQLPEAADGGADDLW